MRRLPGVLGRRGRGARAGGLPANPRGGEKGREVQNCGVLDGLGWKRGVLEKCVSVYTVYTSNHMCRIMMSHIT